jgi:hypothetical protein
MAKHGGARNANSFERFMEDVCLGFRCPDRATWATAVAKTGRSKTMTLYFWAALSTRPLEVKSWIIPELPCNKINGSPSPCSM